MNNTFSYDLSLSLPLGSMCCAHHEWGLGKSSNRCSWFMYCEQIALRFST